MRPCLLLVLVALAMQTVRAADEPPKFQVPKTWEKLYAGDKPGLFIRERNGYVVWTESVVVRETVQASVQSFTETVYRMKLGDKEPEKLDQRVTHRDLVTLLGPKGEVVVGWFAHTDAIYLPGQKPIKFPKEERFAPHQFTADGLLCTCERYVNGAYQVAVALVTIDREKSALGEVKYLRPWFALEGKDGFKPDFYHGRVFLRGDYLAWTGTLPDPAAPGFPKPAFEVWDVRNGKTAWREKATVEAADDTHAYWFPEPNVVARRSLDGKGQAERYTLPKEIIRLDFQPPKLFALVKQDKAWVLTRFDLATGDRAEYDLRAPDGRQVTSGSGGRGPTAWVSVYLVPGGPDYSTSAPVGLDATTGEVRIIHDKAVYRVPESKKIPATEKPKWEPIPAGK